MPQYITHIVDNCYYMKNLVDGLLRYAEYGENPEKPDYVTAQDIIARSLNALSSKIKEKQPSIVISNNLPPNLYVQRTAMIQLFQNILDNAIKFSNKERANIWIDYHYIDKKHRFEIRDDGCGIPSEYAQQVFEMFKRLQAKNMGSGIGLAMCKKIVENHGGEIWIESKEGTSVIFEIPERHAEFKNSSHAA